MTRLSLMKKPLLTIAAVVAASLSLSTPARSDDKTPTAPIRALLITGGCCHNYDEQKVTPPKGISPRALVEWTIVQEGGPPTSHKVSLYQKPDWADGYDVVVHNECFADVGDREFVEKILTPH